MILSGISFSDPILVILTFVRIIVKLQKNYLKRWPQMVSNIFDDEKGKH